jgi:hypothetical protein
MDIFVDLAAAKVVTVCSTSGQRDIVIKLNIFLIGLGFTNCTWLPLQRT